MMAMTTNSSIRVKPVRERRGIMVFFLVTLWGISAPGRTRARTFGLGPRRRYAAGRLDVVRPVQTRSAPEECGNQDPEAGGEDAERAIPAHVAPALGGPGIFECRESGSCRSSFTSRMRMMDGTWVSALRDGA